MTTKLAVGDKITMTFEVAKAALDNFGFSILSVSVGNAKYPVLLELNDHTIISVADKITPRELQVGDVVQYYKKDTYPQKHKVHSFFQEFPTRMIITDTLGKPYLVEKGLYKRVLE
jgi:hypothetical protein